MKHLSVVVIILLLIAGCSGANTVITSPEPTGAPRVIETVDNHAILGLWQMAADPDAGTLEVVTIRDAAFHLNTVHFLEPPPNLYLTLESAPQFSGGNMTVDIGLRHPMLGLLQYTGFDVCGILISQGSIDGFNDPSIVLPGAGDTRLMNADGLTRWWNPSEFPYSPGTPGQGYVDGILGTPDSVANYSATFNGYKYFGDGLDSKSIPPFIDPGTRGSFTAGQKNVRQYVVSLEGDFIFNYAVDASWAPTGVPPWQIEVPDSFPPEANRPEAFFISNVIIENSLWYENGESGGLLSLDVHVYDWFDADQNAVTVESPGAFNQVTSLVPISGGVNFSVYHVDISGPTLASADDIVVLVGAENDSSGYQGKLPGKPVATYAPLLSIPVADSNPGGQVILIPHDEVLIVSDGQANYDDYDPALVVDGTGNMLVSYFWVEQDSDTHWWNRPRFNTSTDGGLTFGPVQYGQWQGHGISPNFVPCYNGKFTVGPDGQAYHSYNCPAGHAVHRMPTFDPYTDAASHSGTPMEHAGEMLYTIDGNPMMFGDKNGAIEMRIGPDVNVAGTGTWPIFDGEHITLVEDGWLSIVRSTGKTSDGIYHLVYWNDTVTDPIKMLSSDDSAGMNWTQDVVIQNGLAEIWDGASDPGLWIDNQDNFHVTYNGKTWMGISRLMYADSSDGVLWNNTNVSTAGPFDDLELHDTGIVTFDAFGKKYIFIVYEYNNDVMFMYREANSPGDFIGPIKVNVHEGATLPDLYPNGANGIVFAYEADGDTGTRDIFCRMYEFVE